ncbi:MAG: carboxypeptidase regulatory-like domain-containing protein [Muribaculaceae bacterium]|nr:carboxypeptidase regulatory-like domain-containing protein [Muribaculaceae bacterium]
MLSKFYQRLTIAFAVLLFGSLFAKADVVSPYTMDFNTVIVTNSNATGAENRDFKVGTGWDHIYSYQEVGYSSTPKYVPYTYSSTQGNNSSGCLYAGTNTVYDSWLGENLLIKDYLVTPPVSGEVTIMVKRKASDGTINFYNVLTENGDLKIDTLITPTTMALTTYYYSKVVLPAQAEGTRIAIQMNNVYIDDFTAESADITLKPGLKVSALDPADAAQVAADADGKFTVSFGATLTNIGDLDIDAGSYSLYITKDEDGAEPLATISGDQAIAKGASTATPVTVSATLNVADYPTATTDGVKFRVYESITGNYRASGAITVVPFAPAPAVSYTVGNTTTNFVSGSTVYMGASREQLGMMLTFANKGGAPITISEVIMPEGFTTSLEAGTVIDALSSTRISIVRDPAVKGILSGDMVIKSNADDFTLKLQGSIPADDQYFVDFETNESTSGMVFDIVVDSYSADGWKSHYTNDLGQPSNTYSAYWSIGSYSTNFGPYLMITPLLEVAEGDVLAFDAANMSTKGVKVEVLYSTDRTNWRLLRTLATDAENADDLISAEKSFKYNCAPTRYILNNIPVGQGYVAFRPVTDEAYRGAFVIDNIIGCKLAEKTLDVVFVSSRSDLEGSVNNKFNASMTVRNLMTAPVEAGSYAANLYLNDQLIGNAEAIAINGPAYTGNGFRPTNDTTIDFSFTPHSQVVDGKLYMEIVFADGSKLASDTVTINITAETYSENLQIGGEYNKSIFYGPVCFYYKKSESQNIYTPAELNGLTPGSKINSITVKGYNTNQGNPAPFNVKVWMTHTNEASFENTGTADSPVFTPHSTDTMTCVYEGVIEATKVGSSLDRAEVFTINLAEPFVYQGGNLEFCFSSEGNSYASTNFEMATCSADQSITRYTDSGEITEKSFGRPASGFNIPILYLGVEAEPKTISGKVTDAASSEPIADIEVKAVNGDVVYSATTDAEGNYSMPIIQDRLAYTVSVVLPGYFPFVKENVSTKSEAQVINIELSKAIGPYITESSIDEKGMVNHAVNASAKVSNYTAADIAEGSYTAKFIVGDSVVCEQPAVAIAMGESADFNFAFTPHVAGTFPALVKFESEGAVAKTDTINLVISEEMTNSLVQVADSTSTGSSSAVAMYYQNTESEMIYTADEIGLQPGTLLSKMYFRGYQSTPKTFEYRLRIYIENTEDDYTGVTSSTFEMRDTTQMICVFNGVDTISKYKGTSTEHVPFFPVDLNKFKYEGKNLRIVYRVSTPSSSDYLAINLEYDNSDQTKAYFRNNDGNDADVALAKKSWMAKPRPVLFLETIASKDVDGTVTSKATGQPLEGAKVRFESGDVYYDAVTDADGKYSATIYQLSLPYTLKVTADEYLPYEAEIGEIDEILTFDAALELAPKTVTGVVTDAVTSAAIEGASVKFAAGEKEFSATTDADGKYSVELTPGVAYTMTVEAENYSSYEYEISELGEVLTFDAALTLAPKTVSGTITDEVTGAAIEGASVTFTAGENVYTTSTDADGKYSVEIVDVYPAYTMTVEAESYDDYENEIGVLADQLTFDAAIRLSAKTVSGTVTDAVTSAAIEGATVTFTAGENAYSAVSDADGKYSVEIADVYPAYTMTVEAEGYESYESEVGVVDSTKAYDAALQPVDTGVAGINVKGFKAFGTEGNIVVLTESATVVRVFDTNGRLINKALVAEGETRIAMQSGIYIVNGFKVVVK